jgi:polyisoprenoid-binding protein YceI
VLINSAWSQIYSCKNGESSFFSEAPLENIEAVSRNMNSVINTSTGDIVFIIPMTSFKFDKALMQEHFNEKYVESDKYPNGTFKGKINETIDWAKNTEQEITATGTLSIHGTDVPRTEKAKLIIINGAISISGSFKVKIADHKITIPKIVIQNIAEIVDVKYNCSYTLYKK